MLGLIGRDLQEAQSDRRSACRFCGVALQHTVVDLGMSPLCESFLAADQLNQMEPFYPLRLYVCDACLLVQVQEYVSAADIFTEYAYFSSYSTSWVDHARRYCQMITARLELGGDSLVIELASNDGYLLQHFGPLGVPVLGIEPAVNVARDANAIDVPTLTEFFGVNLAYELRSESKQADLLIANNVLAQVPDLNDFVAGMQILLTPGGTATLEFPHLAQLFADTQFDTIYHEHFSYFSMTTAQRIFAAHRLVVFDVEELPTHGGSLRLYVRHAADASRPVLPAVGQLVDAEAAAGFHDLNHYFSFAGKVEKVKRDLLEFLIHAKVEGKQTVGYGAPGKGNTLLNYCGVRTDLLEYTVDRNPYKHGRFLPGTHVPILEPERIAETRPDYVLILPWNLSEEITEQLAGIRSWGGRFVVPIPELRVW
jgi:hypothetical protein